MKEAAPERNANILRPLDVVIEEIEGKDIGSKNRDSANSTSGLLNLQAQKREPHKLCPGRQCHLLFKTNESKFAFNNGSSNNPIRRYLFITFVLQLQMFLFCTIPWPLLSDDSERSHDDDQL